MNEVKKWSPTPSTDTRIFVFHEDHITGGKCTVIITAQEIIDFMRVMTARPLDSTHQDWIDEFNQIYDIEEVTDQMWKFK